MAVGSRIRAAAPGSRAHRGRPPAHPAWGRVRSATSVLLTLAVSGALGCERAPVDVPCAQLEQGDLVITELRGPQAGADTYGEWIEVFNASGRELSLGGLAVTSIELDGGGEERFLVRATTLSLAPGEYATLGSLEREPLPQHLDYSFAIDEVGGLKAGGVITLEACGAFVDEVVYRSLPEEGSWALDGAKTPDADTNDDETCWCADTRPQDPTGPMTELGVPGSPREENPSCAG